MLTKDPVKETEKALEQEASFGEVVERSIGLSLGELVESSIGQSLGELVEASIPLPEKAGQGPKGAQPIRTAKPRVAVTAADLLRYLMIPGTCLGFRQLETAINLAVEDENRLLNVIDELYPLVGKCYNATVNSVQKNMRVAIIAGWKDGGDKQLEKLLGLAYPVRPVTKDFIDLLADYLRRRL